MDREREKVEKGAQAKELLENALLRQWWFSAKRKLRDQLNQAARRNDFKTVEYTNAALDNLVNMERDFKRYVSNGERAVSELGKDKPKRGRSRESAIV